MAQLAQAYIHLRPYSASDREIRSLGEYAERTAMNAAAEIYGGDVDIDIEIEEGSLITRITVVGSIMLGVYGAVANYKGFKESLVEMCDDAQDFAVDVCAPFAEKAGVPTEEIYRFERRLKTPGKLYRLGKRLEKLERSVNELSPREMQRQLAKARSEIDSVAADLSTRERRIVFKRLIPKRLPPLQDWPIQDEPQKVVVERHEDTAQLFEGQLLEDGDGLKRRLVFKARKKVPKKSKRRRKKADRRLPLESDATN